MTPLHRLKRLFEPTSIAVVGASTKPGYGRQTLQNLELLDFPGRLVVVHPTAERIGQTEVYRSLAEIPFVPDAVVLAIPAKAVPDVVREAAGLGVGGVVAYASGFRETGMEGRRLEADLREAAGDLPVLGPNCMGLVSYGSRTALWGIEMPRHQQRGSGRVAIASQSGAMLITTLLSGRLPDVAYAASVGNQTVVDLNDCLDFYLTDPGIRVVCLITEGIRDLPRFRRLATQAARQSVSVVVLKIGRSVQAQAATIAHTGTLAGDDETYSASFEQSGVCRVDDLDDMIATCSLLAHVPYASVGKLAVFATSGGEGGLVADVADDVGAQLAELDATTEQQLTDLVPPFGSVGNPFDLTAGAWADTEVYRRVTQTLAGCPGVGLIAMTGDAPQHLGGVAGSGWEEMLAGAGSAARDSGTPVAVVTTTTDVLAEFKELADRHGVLLLAGVRPAMAAVAHAQAAVVPAEGSEVEPDVDPAKVAAARALMAGRTGALGESEAKDLIGIFGIDSPPGGEHDDLDQLELIAAGVGYPVVCKIVGVAHKSDVGGVETSVEDATQLRAACERIRQATRGVVAGPQVIRVERMVTGAVEVIVGGHRSSAGVSVVVGAGGVLTEVMQDVRTLVWPFTTENALDALTRLRIAPLLTGYRGSSPVDLAALAQTVVRAGELLAALPEIAEMDLNPVLATAAGCLAADALLVVNNPDQEMEPR